MFNKGHLNQKCSQAMKLIISACYLLVLLVFIFPAYADKSNQKIITPSTQVQPGFDKTLRGLHQLEVQADGTYVARGKVSGNGQVKIQHIIFENIVSPGNSPGCINITGDATFSTTATLVMEIGGSDPCTGFDRISVGGTLTVNSAAFNLVLIDGFVPVYGQRFDVLDWGVLAGAGFDSIDTSAAVLPSPLLWDLSQLEVTGEVVVGIQSFADGDLAPLGNPDGVVNVADMLIATRIVMGELAPGALEYAHGDMNVDGVINMSDLIQIYKLVLP